MGHIAWMGDGRMTHKLLRKSEGNHPCSRPKIRWESNIIWDLDYEADWKTLAT